MKKEALSHKFGSFIHRTYTVAEDASLEREFAPDPFAFADIVALHLSGAMLILLILALGVQATKADDDSITAEEDSAVRISDTNEQTQAASENKDAQATTNPREKVKSSGAAVKSNQDSISSVLLWDLMSQYQSRSAAEFSSSEASRRIDRAARLARVCIAKLDPQTMTRVALTFANTGRVTKAIVDDGAFVNTPQGACIARVMRSISVPAFDGSPVTFRRTFRID